MSVLNRFNAHFVGMFAFVCLAGGVASSQAATKDVLIMSTAPTQSVAKTMEMYGPLAKYLAEQSGAEIKLVPARNFLEYNSKMRKGEYDILFDGPHYVGWRVKKLGDTAVAKLPGKLVFAAIVKDGGPVTKPAQLIGKKVCAVNSPNLATLSILEQFDNPVRQPIIVSQRSFKDVFACLKKGEGEAAIIPMGFWKKFEKKGQTKGMRILQTTKKRPLPPRTFTVSKRVDVLTREKIAKALVNSEGAPGAKPLLDSFRKKNFVSASSSEYQGLDGLLRSVWGFNEE